MNINEYIFYFKTFVIRFSAISYVTHSIEVLVNSTLYDVKQLEVYGIFLTLLLATYSRHLISEIIFVPFYIIDLLIFRMIVVYSVVD